MWRWVTRGLVLAFLSALLAPALSAQLYRFEGVLERPDPAQVQTGMILVSGWALDPNLISKIELWVDDQYRHDAVKFLPRVDIVEAYPDYPGIHVARPGFVTGFLASNFPNGPHTVEMRIHTQDGQIHFLGRRTITINNSINQAPFGAVDIPDGHGITNAAGSFPVVGWAADTDGLTNIEVLIDDGVVQGAMRGEPRPDVGTSFPDFPGALFSGYVANIDTTRIENGVHVLSVRAVDRFGVSSLIGRRQVQIINNDLFLKPFGFLDEPQRDAVLFGTSCDNQAEPPISPPPIRPEERITPVRGWALDLGTRRAPGRVAYVELLIDGVRWLSTNDCGVVLGGYANCYGLPRYDVQRYYPTYPDSPRSGFLFTLDIGALINLGVRPGGHNMMVRVGDVEGTFTELPSRDGIPVFFECVGPDVDFPAIGFIEFPTSSDYITGDVLFRGWALEGSNAEKVAAVHILIDGNFVGTAAYNFPRTDIEDAFPHIIGSRFSGWVFNMDTRKLTNAKHRVTVVVVDTSGNSNEIGSVDFYVQNNNPQP